MKLKDALNISLDYLASFLDVEEITEIMFYHELPGSIPDGGVWVIAFTLVINNRLHRVSVTIDWNQSDDYHIELGNLKKL